MKYITPYIEQNCTLFTYAQNSSDNLKLLVQVQSNLLLLQFDMLASDWLRGKQTDPLLVDDSSDGFVMLFWSNHCIHNCCYESISSSLRTDLCYFYYLQCEDCSWGGRLSGE